TIAARLKERKSKSRFAFVYAAAACIALLAVFGLLNISTQEHRALITYKTEVVSDPIGESRHAYNSRAEKEAIDFLEEQCKYQKPACGSVEFVELRRELREVNEALLDIDKKMKLFGFDPAIVQAQIRTENQKAYLLKELIQLIRS